MKTPPYGKPLKAIIDQGLIPNNSVYLYIGQHAWERGKQSSISRPSRTLILPPNHSPFGYDWPVNGCDILMIETSATDQEYIENLVLILFASGSIKVILIANDFSISIYNKDF